MVVLGIESTAHTASVGVIGEGAEVLGLTSDMYHPPSGGIHPREAANHHVDLLPGLVEAALDSPRSTPAELEAVAFAQGPGLARACGQARRWPGCSRSRGTVPLVAVNHCVAHVEIARVMSGLDDALLLYASGGNTQVIAFGAGRYRVLGETLDVGIGNFLDKLWIGLGGTFPGGPAIEAAAKEGSNLLPLPLQRPRDGCGILGDPDRGARVRAPRGRPARTSPIPWRRRPTRC